jgi:MATE family, multidrug efflux pump
MSIALFGSIPAAAQLPALSPRTRLLLHGSIFPTLLRLAEHFGHAGANLDRADRDLVGVAARHRRVGRHGAGLPHLHDDADALRRAMGGGISSAVARALGGGRRGDADALVLHAIVVNLLLGLAFSTSVLAFGPSLYGALGGEGRLA